MNKYIIFFAIVLASCAQDKVCNCDYVVYESNPQNDYRVTIGYVSTWDASCETEMLSKSTYYDYDGEPWYDETWIECE